MHLERAAERGRAVASAALEGPAVPEVLRYLYDWLLELASTQGHDMNGNVLPLTHAEIAAWAALRDRRPQPHEVDALLLLDRINRNPPPRGDD